MEAHPETGGYGCTISTESRQKPTEPRMSDGSSWYQVSTVPKVSRHKLTRRPVPYAELMPQPSRDKYLGILSGAMSSLSDGDQDQADYFANLLSVELPPLRRRRASHWAVFRDALAWAPYLTSDP
jgi:hypothetical protein